MWLKQELKTQHFSLYLDKLMLAYLGGHHYFSAAYQNWIRQMESLKNVKLREARSQQ